MTTVQRHEIPGTAKIDGQLVVVDEQAYRDDLARMANKEPAEHDPKKDHPEPEDL